MSDQEIPAIFTRAVLDDVIVREINEGARSATFVAATENGVMTYYGREYLKMSGARLTRYRKNPVVLDAHNRYEAGAVIGRAEVKIEEKKLAATVIFAETARAEEIWTLVKGKFLRALSVGFIPDRTKTLQLAAGESDGEGEDAIVGPASIIRQWELFEISVVPVPADADALRRAMQGDNELAPIVASLTHILERLSGATKESEMAEDNNTPPGAPKDEAPKVEVKHEIRQPSDLERRVADIRAIVPRSLKNGEALADELIASGATVDDACKRFLRELQSAAPPAGTPEPAPVQRDPGKPKIEKLDLAKMTPDEFKRELIG